MPKKLSDLKDLVADIRAKTNFKSEIRFDRLKYEIAVRFGYSDYIVRSTMKALADFGFIKEIGTGTFKFIDKEAHKKEDKQIDKLLKTKKKR